MVKNKTLPDSASHPGLVSLSLSLADAVHPEGSPGSCWGQTLAATHSSILSWSIPWTEESGGLESMGLPRVRHNWATNTHNPPKGHFFLLRFTDKETETQRFKVTWLKSSTYFCLFPFPLYAERPFKSFPVKDWSERLLWVERVGYNHWPTFKGYFLSLRPFQHPFPHEDHWQHSKPHQPFLVLNSYGT